MSRKLSDRVEELEAQFSASRKLYLQVIHLGCIDNPTPELFREVRWLMEDDAEKGRFIRQLEQGEIVPGIENPPWLKAGEN